MKKPGFLIAIFLLLLLAISSVNAYAFWDTQTVSESENRTLSKRPALTRETWLSGAFASGMEDFLADHLYRRSTLISAAKRLEATLERKTEVKLVSHAAADMVAGRTDGGQAGSEQQSPNDPAVVTDIADTAQTQTQERLVLEDRILWAYRDTTGNLNYYSKTANKLYAMFPDYINKYCILTPSRIAFETPNIQKYSDDQRIAIEGVYEELDPLVTTVDVYSALEEHSDRLDDLYFRTDHHWTHLGAYYAAQSLFETIGKEYAPLEEYNRKEGLPFLGYFYAQDPDPKFENHQDELVYYVPKDHSVPSETVYVKGEDGTLASEKGITINQMRGGYYTFIRSAFAYAILDGAKENAGCALVIADSYGYAFSTWLAENYSRVVIIDPRDYEGGRNDVLALATKYDVTDVLICNYLGSIDSMYFTSFIQNLTK